MFRANPLVVPVLNILQTEVSALSLYELLSRVESEISYLLDLEEKATEEVVLFRKNFLLMNALYQIRDDIQGSGYGLFVSPLRIFLSEDQSSEGAALVLQDEDDSSLHSALSEYYMDWSNYSKTSTEDVRELLSGFWRRYTEHQQSALSDERYLDALQTLGVESSASWEDIQQAYRRKVAVSHPDKGGNTQMFIAVRRAYHILQLTLGPGQ